MAFSPAAELLWPNKFEELWLFVVIVAAADETAAQFVVECEGDGFFEGLLLRGSGLFLDVFLEINADKEF